MALMPVVMEIKRIKIRSVFRLVFFFHLFVGLIVGLLLAGAWNVIANLGLEELLPEMVRDIGKPTTSRILVFLSLSSVAMGIVGAIAWSLLTLLYNLIAGFVKGIQFETVTKREGKGSDPDAGG